jgi:hypothetical protein
MADGRGNFEWTQTSHLLALIANVNRGKKSSKVYKPDDLNPYSVKSKRRGIVITKDNVSVMRNAFLGSKK